MKFYTTRSSLGCIDEKPCDKAHKEQASNGEKVWFVNINTLEDLIAFIKEQQHPLIITEGAEHMYIEIYDDYRE